MEVSVYKDWWRSKRQRRINTHTPHEALDHNDHCRDHYMCIICERFVLDHNGSWSFFLISTSIAFYLFARSSPKQHIYTYISLPFWLLARTRSGAPTVTALTYPGWLLSWRGQWVYVYECARWWWDETQIKVI